MTTICNHCGKPVDYDSKLIVLVRGGATKHDIDKYIDERISHYRESVKYERVIIDNIDIAKVFGQKQGAHDYYFIIIIYCYQKDRHELLNKFRTQRRDDHFTYIGTS